MIDFLNRQLPVYLSKSILNSLDKKSISSCLFVCKYWCNLIKEVHKEGFLQKVLIDDMMFLKVQYFKLIKFNFVDYFNVLKIEI